MPAPPSGLVNALRAGTVARHVFFTLTHVDGDVRCWDGIGDFTLSGNTFKGVGGLMRIEGISDSGDVQNHQVAVTLNGVALSSVNLVTLSIRNEAASLVFAWIAEDGAVEAARTVFAGLGDTLRTKFTADENSVTAILRAPLAEWRTPPRAYYTDQDQQRRFPGDTGFSLVSQLENVSVSGWSKNPEASGAVPTLRAASSSFKDDVDGVDIGVEGWGLTLFCYSDPAHSLGTRGGSTKFYEETTGAAAVATANSAGAKLQVGGVNTYIDLAGIVRSAGGLRLFPTADTTHFVRKHGPISSAGSATSTTVTATLIATTPFFKKTGTTISTSAPDWSGFVYENSMSYSVYGDGTVTSGNVLAAAGVPWLEESTGNAVTYSGGLMLCNGANCVVSSTGAIITNTGRMLRPSGSADSNEFMRVWT